MGENLRILELFSGIGGMHTAFKYSRLPGKVYFAVDINPVANTVYKSNYPRTTVLNKNIQKLSAKQINKFDVNTILMSPPCQPFTRVGLKKDVNDARMDALKHLCDIFSDLHTIDFILMENVKGFEDSVARTGFINTLQKAGFHFREFILSPHQFGVPNTRHRYYCIARRGRDFGFERKEFWEEIPSGAKCKKPFIIKDILEPSDKISDDSRLPDDVLSKRACLFDIVTPDSSNSICFTKAYTHYTEGTGSIFTPCSNDQKAATFEKLKNISPESPESMKLLRALGLRYFSPREVARLMSFPDEFKFPDQTTARQRYRLLGNSINIVVVGELMKVLRS